MQLFQNDKNRISLTLIGKVTAVTPISVTRPDDNFKSLSADDKKPRLPRMGAKRDDVSPFIPGSSFRGGLRRCALAYIARNLGCTFTTDQVYMLVEGVDTTKLTSAENVNGEIDKEASLREINPMLSLFGRWGLSGHIGVGDLIPFDKNCIFTAGAGVRTNEFIRNPSATQFIDETELSYLKELLKSDTDSSAEVREIESQLKKLIKSLRDAENSLEKARINEEISTLEAKKKDVRANKIGSENTIQRPLSGFEALIPGTLLSQRLPLMMVNKSELGLFLSALAEFARNPTIGGHKNYACGEISAEYTLNYWPEDEDKPRAIASISFNDEGFVITGDAADELYQVRDQFKNDLKAQKFDFTQYLFDPSSD